MNKTLFSFIIIFISMMIGCNTPNSNNANWNKVDITVTTPHTVATRGPHMVTGSIQPIDELRPILNDLVVYIFIKSAYGEEWFQGTASIAANGSFSSDSVPYFGGVFKGNREQYTVTTIISNYKYTIDRDHQTFYLDNPNSNDIKAGKYPVRMEPTAIKKRMDYQVFRDDGVNWASDLKFVITNPSDGLIPNSTDQQKIQIEGHFSVSASSAVSIQSAKMILQKELFHLRLNVWAKEINATSYSREPDATLTWNESNNCPDFLFKSNSKVWDSTHYDFRVLLNDDLWDDPEKAVFIDALPKTKIVLHIADPVPSVNQ